MKMITVLTDGGQFFVEGFRYCRMEDRLDYLHQLFHEEQEKDPSLELGGNYVLHGAVMVIPQLRDYITTSEGMQSSATVGRTVECVVIYLTTHVDHGWQCMGKLFLFYLKMYYEFLTRLYCAFGGRTVSGWAAQIQHADHINHALEDLDSYERKRAAFLAEIEVPSMDPTCWWEAWKPGAYLRKMWMMATELSVIGKMVI